MIFWFVVCNIVFFVVLGVVIYVGDFFVVIFIVVCWVVEVVLFDVNNGGLNGKVFGFVKVNIFFFYLLDY